MRVRSGLPRAPGSRALLFSSFSASWCGASFPRSAGTATSSSCCPGILMRTLSMRSFLQSSSSGPIFALPALCRGEPLVAPLSYAEKEFGSSCVVGALRLTALGILSIQLLRLDFDRRRGGIRVLDRFGLHVFGLLGSSSGLWGNNFEQVTSPETSSVRTPRPSWVAFSHRGHLRPGCAGSRMAIPFFVFHQWAAARDDWFHGGIRALGVAIALGLAVLMSASVGGSCGRLRIAGVGRECRCRIATLRPRSSRGRLHRIGGRARFAEGGYTIFAGRQADKLRAAAYGSIESCRRNMRGARMDARREEEVVRFLQQRSIRPLEICVVNPGANVNFPILETTERVFRKVWEMACYAGFLRGTRSRRLMLAA